MRIALILDNPFRDLPGIVLLASRLCQSPVTCYLVPLNLASREVSALAPDFVLLTSLRRPRQRFARQLLDAGIQIGVLDAEGGVVPSLEMYGKLTNPDLELYDRVTCFCSWGPKIANYVTTESWYDDDQVTITGSPRFDFYSPSWRDAALRFSAVAPSDKPIILINGSFPRANPVILTREREVQSWMANGFNEEYIRRYQEVEYQTLIGMAGIANHLASKFPQADVVYRPHPFEKLETYGALLDDKPNLRLIKEGTVEGWILQSSAVIQHHCTTAIEAGMAAKPAFLPDWLPTAQRIESTETVSVKCQTQDELDDHIREILSGNSETANTVRGSVEQVLSDWFHAIDGKANERVANAILSSSNVGHTNIDISACRKIHYGWGMPDRSLKARLGAGLRMGLRLPISWSNKRMCDVKDWHKWWDDSAKHFDVDLVQSVINALGPFDKQVMAKPARENTDYKLRYTVGRSVVLTSS